MMSFTEFAYSLLSGYIIFQLVLVVWGIAAVAVWYRGPYRNMPVILDTYPIFQMAPFEVRWHCHRPRPVDIAKAIFCTFCPVVNVLLMGSMFAYFVMVSVYRILGAGVRVASRLATGDANRVKTWFFTPMGRD
jgi:hypothetical protein